MKIKVDKMLISMAASGLTINELADRSGVSRNTISAIKAGKANCRPDKVGAIAKALGVDVAELIETELAESKTSR